MIKIYSHETKIGPLTMVENEGYLVEICFGKKKYKHAQVKDSPVIKKAFEQLEEYFTRKRKAFDLPLRPQGTEFQRRVWAALLDIPYGETRTYKEVAIKVGSPKAFRAVGMANNKNPLPIVIPCHRVIGSNKKLIGYEGGLEIKKRLLMVEGFRDIK